MDDGLDLRDVLIREPSMAVHVSREGSDTAVAFQLPQPVWRNPRAFRRFTCAPSIPPLAFPEITNPMKLRESQWWERFWWGKFIPMRAGSSREKGTSADLRARGTPGQGATEASRRRGRPSEREVAFGLLIDYREVYPAVRTYLGRKKLAIGKRDPSSWLKHGIELIHAVWGQTQFLSGREWRRSQNDHPLLPAPTLNPETGDPGWPKEPPDDPALLTDPETGEPHWQTKLPDDGELTAWLEELAALPSRRMRLPRLLACRIVAYRWRLNLSPESIFDKIRAAAEKSEW